MLTRSRQLRCERSPLLSPDMGLYTLSCLSANSSFTRVLVSPPQTPKHAQLHLHQAEQLLLPGSPNMPAQVLHLPRSLPGTLTV